jgi:hypothetical protein
VNGDSTGERDVGREISPVILLKFELKLVSIQSTGEIFGRIIFCWGVCPFIVGCIAAFLVSCHWLLIVDSQL